MKMIMMVWEWDSSSLEEKEKRKKSKKKHSRWPTESTDGRELASQAQPNSQRCWDPRRCWNQAVAVALLASVRGDEIPMIDGGCRLHREESQTVLHRHRLQDTHPNRNDR